MNRYNGGCDTCKHHMTDICEGCKWYYDDLKNLYETASPEEIAMAEERSRQKKIIEAIDEYIECDLPDTFLQAYETAKTFAAHNHFRNVLMGVKITEDKHLIASDSYMMIDIPCPDIPDKFKGRIIMYLDGNKVGLSSLLYPDHVPIFSTGEGFKRAYLHHLPHDQIPVADRGHGDQLSLLALHTPECKIYFDADRINKVKSALYDVIIVAYKDATSPAVFTGDNARAVVCSARYKEEG